MGKATQSVLQNSASLHVFIVEDSQPVRERIEEMLSSIQGTRCAGWAATAEAAIRGILDTHPHAVILDVGLAQGSGFAVLRAVQGCTPQIPVYVFSNFSIEPYRRLAIRLGATVFFDKTDQIEDMRELLTQHAAQHTNPLH